MYQGKIMNESTTRLTQDANIGWTGIPTLTFAVTNDELNLTVTPTITSSSPDCSFQWCRTAFATCGIKVISSNQFSFDYDKMYRNNGGEQILSPNTTMPVQATYDASLQKYVASVYFTGNYQNLANTMIIYNQIKLRRFNMETLWTYSFQPYNSSGEQNWNSNNTQTAAVRGE